MPTQIIVSGRNSRLQQQANGVPLALADGQVKGGATRGGEGACVCMCVVVAG